MIAYSWFLIYFQFLRLYKTILMWNYCPVCSIWQPCNAPTHYLYHVERAQAAKRVCKLCET